MSANEDTANEGVADRVRAVIEKQVNPRLRWEGGHVELISVNDGGTVNVRLVGSCATCPFRQLTLVNFVESTIKENVPEVKSVVAAPS